MSDMVNLHKLMPYLKTTYDAKRLLHMLEHLEDALFKNTTTFEETFKKDLPFPLNELLTDLFTEQNIKVTDQANVKIFLTKLITTIRSLPTINLTISMAPTGQFVDNISKWISLNMQRPLLLAITVDPKLIAGVKIGFGGKYYDYSLQSKFNAINAEEILGMQPKNV